MSFIRRGGWKVEALPWVLLGVFFTLGLLSMRHKTLTVDEDGHWRYGAQVLALKSDRFDDSKMPATALNAVPLKLAERLPAGALQNVIRKLPTARAVTLLAAVLLGYLCYLWSRRLYGLVPGLLTVLLVLVEIPEIQVHLKNGNRRAVWELGRRLFGHGLLAGGVILLVVNAGFLFNRTFTPLQDYEFQSGLFRGIQTSLTNLPFIRIPVPYPFLEGLDLVRFRERTGFDFGDIYMLGQLSKDGFTGGIAGCAAESCY